MSSTRFPKATEGAPAIFVWSSRVLLLVAGAAFVATTVSGVPSAWLWLFATLGLAIVMGLALNVVEWLAMRPPEQIDVEIAAIIRDPVPSSGPKRKLAVAITAVGACFVALALLATWLVALPDAWLLLVGMLCAGTGIVALGIGYLSDAWLRDDLARIAAAVREGRGPDELDGADDK